MEGMIVLAMVYLVSLVPWGPELRRRQMDLVALGVVLDVVVLLPRVQPLRGLLELAVVQDAMEEMVILAVVYLGLIVAWGPELRRLLMALVALVVILDVVVLLPRVLPLRVLRVLVAGEVGGRLAAVIQRTRYILIRTDVHYAAMSIHFLPKRPPWRTSTTSIKTEQLRNRHLSCVQLVWNAINVLSARSHILRLLTSPPTSRGGLLLVLTQPCLRSQLSPI
jgi:hypothetical protein